MKKLFNKTIDINGKICKYPLDENGVVFCFTEDKNYCIYALYTKKDLTKRAIIQLSYDKYLEEFNAYKSRYKKEPITIFLPSLTAIELITSFAKYKATLDNMTVEDLLTPLKGEDK